MISNKEKSINDGNLSCSENYDDTVTFTEAVTVRLNIVISSLLNKKTVVITYLCKKSYVHGKDQSGV